MKNAKLSLELILTRNLLCFILGCPEPHLLACAQFGVCPTDPDGRNGECSLAPNIVTNSWGGGQGEDFFDDAIQGTYHSTL